MKHLILTLALLCGMIIPSVGHEWWGNGTEVDPETTCRSLPVLQQVLEAWQGQG